MENALLEGVFDIVRGHFRDRMNRELPVRTWRTPAELAEILKVSVDESGMDADELISTIDTYL